MRLVSHPVLCNYYVTYRCNAKCTFCDIWEQPSPYIKLEDVQANLKDLKKLGVKVIDFTGGEPLLHRELDMMLGMAKEMGFLTTVTTNGMLYPKQAENLKGKIDMLHFSLDAVDKEVHDQGRGVACYDLVMKSIDVAKSLGERPDILFTAMNSNIDQLAAIYQDVCLPNELLLIINPVFGYNDIDTGGGLSLENLALLKDFGKKPMVYLNEAFIELRLDGGNHINDPVCKAASTTIVISPENKLVMPCYHAGLSEVPINRDLYELYHSPEMQKMIEMEGRLPVCEGCTINCYMQPSFSVEMSKYWWKALPSTLKYNWIKGTWKSMLPWYQRKVG